MTTAHAPAVPGVVVPPLSHFGKAAVADAEHRSRGCARPVRLVGSTVRRRVDPLTGEPGEVIERYTSAQELDGITWVRCGDRRAARCESCSREYKGDAWHLLSAGLVGGKGRTRHRRPPPDDLRHAHGAVVRAGARPPPGRPLPRPP